MTMLRIVHRTRYVYDRPVRFGVHHLMLRPRDAHDMRILRTGLSVSPNADLRWAFDTFGNSVGMLTFHDADTELSITSELELRRYGLDDPLPLLANSTGDYPFRYDPDEIVDLAPLRRLLYPQDRAAIERWVAAIIPALPPKSLGVLHRLGNAIHEQFEYRRRDEYGTQSPAETIEGGAGTCRDFALLFMEAARTLGFAARFVTGYLYDPARDSPENQTSADGEVKGGGSTHAWADIFVPGAGWIEFDPTNRIVASRNLVRVATTRSPAQAVPISGTFLANGARSSGMEVSVSVTEL